MNFHHKRLLLGFIAVLGGFSLPEAFGQTDAEQDRLYHARIVPFFRQFCVECHNAEDAEADLNLLRYQESSNVQEEFALWERMLRVIQEREMPPADQPQPDAETVARVSAAIRSELESFDCSGPQPPGRVTIRRLNRNEYNNTIRDLFGVEFRPADDFPSDDVGYGFDNIADVLSMSPILLEKYLQAAESIVLQVFADPLSREIVERDSALRDGRGRGNRDGLAKDIRRLANRAFRRPITEQELEKLMQLADRAAESRDTERHLSRDASGPRSGVGQAWENSSLQTAMLAVLTSPHFLFRIENDQPYQRNETNGIDTSFQSRPLNDYEVATRLSYFLWSSMPDERLFQLAVSGTLRDPAVLAAEVQRMLADPKARALVDHFAGQWLQLRDVDVLSPDPGKYPEFDEELRSAMRAETEQFFRSVMREDRSVLDFLQADESFINERLARHYGIEGVRGQEFQRVKLPAQRRGILTHASVLMLTSNPTRTSPVKRGQWILTNILGEPPPPAPAGVEELDESAETLGSLRERMEQHRSNVACAVCHRQMDALGFGLENFDGIGAWRDLDGRFPIDPSGELPGNQTFSGPAELMQVLTGSRREAFCRCLAEKFLTYALGRGLGPQDRCAVNQILQQLEAGSFRFSALVTAIVSSDPFLYRQLAGDE